MNDVIFGNTAMVLDANDNYVELVVMCQDTSDPEAEPHPYMYTLKKGEYIREGLPMPPSDMCVKHWTGNGWEEAASEKQLAEWTAEHEAELPTPGVTTEQRVEMLENVVLDLLMGGAANV